MANIDNIKRLIDFTNKNIGHRFRLKNGALEFLKNNGYWIPLVERGNFAKMEEWINCFAGRG
jgi:hypothetical protein